MTESKTIVQSIHDFQHNRKKLQMKEEDDLSDQEIDAIYKQISLAAKNKKLNESRIKLYDGLYLS